MRMTMGWLAWTVGVSLASASVRAQQAAPERFVHTPFPTVPSTLLVTSTFAEGLRDACESLDGKQATLSASAVRAPADAELARAAQLASACQKLQKPGAEAITPDELALLRQLRDAPEQLSALVRRAEHGVAPRAAAVSGGLAGGDATSGSGLGALGEPLIRGLAEFLATRARQETAVYLKRELAQELCVAPNDQLFAATCAAVGALGPEQSLQSIGATLRAATQQDLRALPDAGLDYLRYLHPELAGLAYAGRLGNAYFGAVAEGRSPVNVLRELSALPEAACPQAGPCRAFDGSLRWASALVYALQQGGSSWSALYKGVEAQDAGPLMAALLLLAEKRLADTHDPGLITLDPVFLQAIVARPVYVWQDVMELEARWSALAASLQQDPPLDQASRRAQLVAAISESLRMGMRLVGNVAALLSAAQARAGTPLQPAAAAREDASLLRAAKTLPPVLQPSAAQSPAPSALTQLAPLLREASVFAAIAAQAADQRYAAATVATLAELRNLCAAYPACSAHETLHTLQTLASLGADIATAQSSNEVAAVLDAYAAPIGTYREKYRRPLFALGAMVGAQLGGEGVSAHGVGGWSGMFAGLAPVGVQLTAPLGASGRDNLLYVGGMLSVIDLGALTTYRFYRDVSRKGMTAQTEHTSQIGWPQVFSPGGYVTLGLFGTPFVAGVGISFAPELREITTAGQRFDASALRVGAFLAVDVPILPLN